MLFIIKSKQIKVNVDLPNRCWIRRTFRWAEVVRFHFSFSKEKKFWFQEKFFSKKVGSHFHLWEMRSCQLEILFIWTVAGSVLSASVNLVFNAFFTENSFTETIKFNICRDVLWGGLQLESAQKASCLFIKRDHC